jgi:hypothetical protein
VAGFIKKYGEKHELEKVEGTTLEGKSSSVTSTVPSFISHSADCEIIEQAELLNKQEEQHAKQAVDISQLFTEQE